MDLQDLFRELITLIVVIDPIGSVPVFLYATASVPARLHTRFAVRAVLIAAIVLFVFLVGGQFALEALGLRLGSFQIAGGLVLFLFAMSMIFGDSKPEAEIDAAEIDAAEIDAAKIDAVEREDLSGAVFPMAMPSIASPGAMLAVVILTDNNDHSITEQAETAVLLAVVLVLTLGLLLIATRIQRVIGDTGASVISRVMGMILATIAVDSVIDGLNTMGVLHLTAVTERIWPLI